LILLDTNVFLELLLGQRKAEDCEVILQRASEGKSMPS